MLKCNIPIHDHPCGRDTFACQTCKQPTCFFHSYLTANDSRECWECANARYPEHPALKSLPGRTA